MFSDRSGFPNLAAQEYTSETSDDVIIQRHTNPWIEVNGEPINWMRRSDLPPATPNDCDTCSGEPVAGVLLAMDADDGIQRCDMCGKFEGDLDAAQAVADLIGGKVLFYSRTSPRRPLGS